MNVDKILFGLADDSTTDLPVEALNAAKANWEIFYPELEKIMDQFIDDDRSLTVEQNNILFLGTLLAVELRYTPTFDKVLRIFSRSDTFLTPIEEVYGDALTELTPSIFYILSDGKSDDLFEYIMAPHLAMYCKSSAIEAIFAQFEAQTLSKPALMTYITRWKEAFIATPNYTNSFLLSVLAGLCMTYELNEYKAEFIALTEPLENGDCLFDVDRLSLAEIKDWPKDFGYKLLQSGFITADFNLEETLADWGGNVDDSAISFEHNEALYAQNSIAEMPDINALLAQNGELASMLYDENFILENSVPVSSVVKIGRNDPCSCGSGKKYKKCCL